MKKIINDTRLMIRACDLYYNENKNQQQIASILNVSRPTVSQLLAGAVQQKLVSITIHGLDTVKHWELEESIKEKFHLKDVIVIDSSLDKEEEKRRLGTAAARYLEGIVHTGDKVGVSMGSTLYHMACCPITRSVEGLTFVPLVGGMGRLRTELHANNLAQNLARQYHGTYLPLYTPARVSSNAVRRELKQELSVSEVLAMQKEISIAMVGIGYPNESSSIKATGYYKDNEIDALLSRGVVGELCMQFYDIEGDTSLYRDFNTMIGISVKSLRKVPFSVGVAGGTDKAQAVIGAIRGKYINVLITDYDCAMSILK